MSAEAYQRGYQDQGKGLSFLDNPYEQDSVEARRWVDGYVKAMQDKRDQTANPITK